MSEAVLVLMRGLIVSLLQQGSRSSSSACGSADVLEALGVVIDLGPEVSENYIESGNLSISFLGL